jgi:hypothetical protein
VVRGVITRLAAGRFVARGRGARGGGAEAVRRQERRREEGLEGGHAQAAAWLEWLRGHQGVDRVIMMRDTGVYVRRGRRQEGKAHAGVVGVCSCNV